MPAPTRSAAIPIIVSNVTLPLFDRTVDLPARRAGRENPRMRRLLVVATAAAGYLLWGRPRLLRLGATDDEASAALPGDELLTSVGTQSTMATTIPAPPERVWPWLAQMGCNRAGWYSWDWLDNARRPSATRIVEEWQHLSEGDRLSSTPSGATYFTAAIVDPPRALVLRADLTIGGKPFDPAVELPAWWSSSTWALVLRPTDDGGTRLVVRTRSTSRPAWPQRILSTAFWEPAHAIMQRRQFENLRRRTEHAGGAGNAIGGA